MRTLFITGSDTGIGKTRVAAAVARLLWQPSLQVQFVKPLETGRGPDEIGDAEEAAKLSGIQIITTHTLIRLKKPLAPLAAAGDPSGAAVTLPSLLKAFRALPPADLRIVEGAGGIAVPIDPDGSDWSTFAQAIQADRVVLVTPDRLGAINQGRLAFAYAKSHGLATGVWLNETVLQSEEIRQSNREGLSNLPLWATQRFNASLPEDPDAARRHLSA